MRMHTLIGLLALPATLGAQVGVPSHPVEPLARHQMEAALEQARMGLAQLEPAMAQARVALEQQLVQAEALTAMHLDGMPYLESSLAGLGTSLMGMQARLEAEGIGADVQASGIYIPGRASRRLPPEPRADQQQDPADSLYRAARAAMTRGDYGDAASMFERLVARFERSTYAGDALYWQAFSLYRVGGERNLDRAMRALERQGERYGDASTRRNGEAEQLATRIRGQLARLGDPQAAAGIAEEAQDPCDTPQQEMRLAALNALLQMDADQAMPILKDVLERRDDCSGELRRKATFLISQHESPETVDILMDAARNDPDMEVRRQAVFWLSQVDDDRAVEALESVLSTATDEELAKRAAFALAQHESPRASRALRQAAENDQFSVELRKQVIFWLGQTDEGQQENVDFLKQLFGRLQNAELKERVIFAVAQTETADAGRWLLDIAMDQNQDQEIREKALFWAGEAGAPIEQLVQLYDRMQDRGIKERLLFTYSQREEPQALDKLIDVAKNETDPELRKKAIFWIGQSDDPRAAQALLEIING